AKKAARRPTTKRKEASLSASPFPSLAHATSALPAPPPDQRQRRDGTAKEPARRAAGRTRLRRAEDTGAGRPEAIVLVRVELGTRIVVTSAGITVARARVAVARLLASADALVGRGADLAGRAAVAMTLATAAVHAGVGRGVTHPAARRAAAV